MLCVLIDTELCQYHTHTYAPSLPRSDRAIYQSNWELTPISVQTPHYIDQHYGRYNSYRMNQTSIWLYFRKDMKTDGDEMGKIMEMMCQCVPPSM